MIFLANSFSLWLLMNVEENIMLSNKKINNEELDKNTIQSTVHVGGTKPTIQYKVSNNFTKRTYKKQSH